MKEVFVTVYEGEEQFLTELVSYLEQKYQGQAVIIPGVLKRKK